MLKAITKVIGQIVFWLLVVFVLASVCHYAYSTWVDKSNTDEVTVVVTPIDSEE